MNATISGRLDRSGVLKAGRYLFATGLIGFGIQNFIYHDFIAGRAPAWPFFLPGKLVWAYSSGAIFILAGALILLEKRARTVTLFCAFMVFQWALLRHLPMLVGVNFQWGVELTSAGKALTLFGGMLTVAGSLPRETDRLAQRFPRIVNGTFTYLGAGRYCMAIFLVISGVEHFIFLQYVQSLVPAWIPGNTFWAQVAGVALVAGGIGLVIPRTAPLAAFLAGAMIFIWFTMLHIPRALSAPVPEAQNEWTAVVESLTFSGIAFVLTGYRDPK